MNETVAQLKPYLPSSIINSLDHLSIQQLDTISEIRLRLNRPASITIQNKNLPLIDYHTAQIIKTGESEIETCFKKICENSVYKYEFEIKKGYITLQNGCRVGFCGTRVESGHLKHVSSLNFRISRNIIDAAREIYPLIVENNRIFSSLIVGAPCTGKTTILSDLAVKLSDNGNRVAIIDERSEITAVHRGEPQKAVGQFCDILDGYPKGEGMMIALRSLSPQVIICDEVGSGEDVTAMAQAMNAGVPIIATVHAESAEALLYRPQIKQLFDIGAIEKLIVLAGAKTPGKLLKAMFVRELYENNCNFDYTDRNTSVGQKIYS
ncbi:MAG: Flp pilus assembly complex ATPase component TadA [Clostridia bacterium]|nr:Flp pilus assembly complex ATPase component TadA [Clostridia bacterium]